MYILGANPREVVRKPRRGTHRTPPSAKAAFWTPVHFENGLRVWFFRLENHGVRTDGPPTCANEGLRTARTGKCASNFKHERRFRSEREVQNPVSAASPGPRAQCGFRTVCRGFSRAEKCAWQCSRRMIGVVRSPEAPSVLTSSAAEDRYRHREVVERLISDFHGKCYICEIDSIQDPEVEHLLPHKNGTILGRKFAWNNLLLCCRHCNGVKNKDKYEERVIDCCVRDPEALVDQELEENTVIVRAFNQTDDEAVGIAELIEEVFMSSNPPLRELAAKARLEELQKRMNLLYKTKNLDLYPELAEMLE